MGLKDKVLLEASVPAAAKTLDEMSNPKYISADKAIPLTLLKNCEGLAFITIYKAGLFMIGGQVGGGCVIAKIPDESAPGGFRWSGPVGVQVGGLQGGFIFGGEKISSIIILNTKGAIRGFMGDGQIQFGGSLSLAAGPTGRDMAANIAVSDNKEIIPAYSYSVAKGAYIGATLDGVVLKVNHEDNQKYYGRPVTADAIISGTERPPLGVNVLYSALDASLQIANSSSKKDIKPLGASGKDLLTESLAEGALPAGWKTLYTEDGKPYYFNEATNTTTWDKPAASPPVPAPAPAPAPPPPPAAGLPAGWEELKTPEGKPYYFNKASNTTQWEKP